MIESAINIAVRSHYNQKRKGTELPYIVHPIDVMRRVAYWGMTDQEILAAAVLHDTLEECAKNKVAETEFCIRQSCGKIVLRIVQALTHNPSKQTKAKYIESFSNKSKVVIIIKLADRLCNLNDFWMADNPYYDKYFEKGMPLFKLVPKLSEASGFEKILADCYQARDRYDCQTEQRTKLF